MRVSPTWILRALVVASLPLALAATTYDLVDLGEGAAQDISNLGIVVGNSAAGGWKFDGTTRAPVSFQARYLGGPPEQLFNQSAASANAINDLGTIVGHVLFPGPSGGTQTPFVYAPGSIAVLVGGYIGTGINNAGDAVGGIGSSSFILRGATATTIGGVNARPFAINDAGLVVGSVTVDGVEIAARLDGDSLVPLDLSGLNLPAPGPGAYYTSRAKAVNTTGMIVGWVTHVSGAPVPGPGRAFLHSNGQAGDLGSLGGNSAAAWDVNADGAVVGTATTPDGAAHAFIRSAGPMVDLNPLIASGGAGWVLTAAHAVNNNGWIVGEGTQGGATRAFLLKPLTSGLPPAVVFQPRGASPFQGEPFSLEVTASGTPPLAYQWKHAGTNLPAATDRIFRVASSDLAHAGTYQVVISNAFGQVTSDAVQVIVKERAELGIAFYAGLEVSGPVGRTYRIEAVEHAGNTDWQPLGEVTLAVSPTFWLDRSTPQHWTRVYRAVSVP